MTEKTTKYLYDILDAILNINEFIGEPKIFEIYQKDKKTKSAVERQISIIGEAVNKITKEEKDILLDNSAKIISLRNRVIHAYDNIDDTIIWAIVINHLPKLEKEIRLLLNKTN